MKRQFGVSLVPWLAAVVVVILLSARGGLWLLWLLALPYLGWAIYRDLNPGPPRPVAPRFAQPGEHRVVLQVSGKKPVSVIVQLRRTTGMGLTDAQKFVETPPVVVAEGLSQRSADLIVVQLRRAGAKAVATPIGEM
jgi:hypothetical protein